MSVADVLHHFQTYGLIYLFVIVFLEYLNLPGLPAGIIMPAAGVLIAQSQLNFLVALIVSVIAGILGSICLYALGYFGGYPIVNKLCGKFHKLRKSVEATTKWIDKYGNKGIVISRIIPVARTLISLVAGVFQMPLIRFLMYSAVGITIWNFVFIYAGYLLSDVFLKM